MEGSHYEKMIRDFKKRFWISLFFTIPILIFSPMIQSIFFYSFRFFGDLYILFFLSSIVFFYGGWPFLKGAYNEIKTKNFGMMTLIGLAILVAFVYSSLVVFGLKGKIFFWELATLVDIMLLGHYIEMRSILGASRSLELLVKMMPSIAHREENENIFDVKIDQLKIDDIVLVKPGEKIPTDGIIVNGMTYIDESMVTGESKPVKKEFNAKVIGGSINGNHSIKVKVTHLGKDSYLSKVIHLVREAQKDKSKTQRLADKAAKWLTFIAILSGIFTFIFWRAFGENAGFSLERMVTVMVICCPHALGLAIPLVIAVSTSLCAKSGLLIRNRTALENARKITLVAFDKTGTLTKGKFGVKEYQSFSKNYSSNEILRLAASLEQYSEHPIGLGICEKAKESHLDLLEISDFKNLPGEGIEGKIEEKKFLIIGPSYLKEHSISMKDFPEKRADTMVVILMNQQAIGYITLSDEIRSESYSVIQKLKKNRIKTLMITGDNEKVAKTVSQELNLDFYYANVLPHEKLNIIKDLQKKGEFVAMTGDGVNDAPALAEADIGIAIGSGTDVAAETADIILVKSNPSDILALIFFGKATYRKMIQNLVWATGYNAIAIPLAAGILYSYGVIITPAIGAVLMSISTIIVAINAKLLILSKSLKFAQK